MELREWQYINKPAGSTSSNVSNKSFKKRFEKLIRYYGNNLPVEVDYVMVNLLTNDTLNFTENFDNGDKVIFNISIDPATEAWTLKYSVNSELLDTHSDKGWPKLLDTLRIGYIDEIPNNGTPEYNSLLTESLNEWKYANPPKASQPASSKTNKEKFTELVAYMQKHKDSSVIFTSVNGPNDTGFEYEEQRSSADGSEYNLSVEVSLSKHDLFTIHIDTDGKRKYNIMAKGWEELLRYLRIYFHAPNMGSPEYKSLTESLLNEWKYMNPPKNSQPAVKPQSQVDRYKSLLAQIDADGLSTYKVNELTEDTLDITLDTYKKKDLNIKIIYNPSSNDYSLQVGGRVVNGWDYEKEILELFIVGNIIYSTNLCESSASFAADFKLYENLF